MKARGSTIVVARASDDADADMRDRHGHGVPMAFNDALRIMDYFANHAADGTGYDEKLTKPYDVEVVSSFLSEQGVRLTNLSEGSLALRLRRNAWLVPRLLFERGEA